MQEINQHVRDMQNAGSILININESGLVSVQRDITHTPFPYLAATTTAQEMIQRLQSLMLREAVVVPADSENARIDNAKADGGTRPQEVKMN
jgi:hypothetical protein